jgi:hypothetical protein
MAARRRACLPGCTTASVPFAMLTAAWYAKAPTHSLARWRRGVPADQVVARSAARVRGRVQSIGSCRKWGEAVRPRLAASPASAARLPVVV